MRRASRAVGRATRQFAGADWIPRKGGPESTGSVNLSAGVPGGENALTLLSINVAGLRAVLRSETKSKAFQDAVARVRPSVLCLQEHKLQEIVYDDCRTYEEAAEAIIEVLIEKKKNVNAYKRRKLVRKSVLSSLKLALM